MLIATKLAQVTLTAKKAFDATMTYPGGLGRNLTGLTNLTDLTDLLLLDLHLECNSTYIIVKLRSRSLQDSS